MNLREIDRLVAEKVMGSRVEGVVAWYSTDIAAAWEVVEAMNHRPEGGEPRGTWFSLSVRRGSWCAEFHYGSGKAWNASAPLAICLAALRAKGVEVPNV